MDISPHRANTGAVSEIDETLDRGLFGEWLNSARAAKGFTVNRLADRAEISSAHVSKLENRKANPSREMVKRLAAELVPSDTDERASRAFLDTGLKAAGFLPEGGGPPDNWEDWPDDLRNAILKSRQLSPEVQEWMYRAYRQMAEGAAAIRKIDGDI